MVDPIDIPWSLSILPTEHSPIGPAAGLIEDQSESHLASACTYLVNQCLVVSQRADYAGYQVMLSHAALALWGLK